MAESASELAQQAAAAIQNQDFAVALERANGALLLDSDHSDALVMKGIALTNLGRSAEAAGAFQAAVAANPDSAKALYNFATFLYQSGRRQEAMAYAQQAQTKDPSMQAAADLIHFLSQEAPPEQSAQQQPMHGHPYGEPPTFAQYPREGYVDSEHTIAWIKNLGNKWESIGWGLAFGGLVLFAVSMVHAWPVMSQVFDMLGSGKDPTVMSREIAATGSPALQILEYLAQFSVLTWTVLDIIDRRSNWVWLAPIVICCCCQMQWSMLPLYILFGRYRRN